jgi:ubiquitin-protein ligase
MSGQACKRIMKVDMVGVQQMELSKLGIHVSFVESDITKAFAMIVGPKDTPYEDGILYFTIKFPRDYPFSPPLVQYFSYSRIRIHPNLYVGKSHQGFLGKVCLSILNTWSGPKWTSVQTISSVLLSIQSLLCNQPITNEPGYDRAKRDVKELYNRIVYHDTLAHLILHNSRPPTPEFAVFKEALREHFKERLPDILLRATTYAKKFQETHQPYFRIYGLNPKLDFPNLYKRLSEWADSY